MVIPDTGSIELKATSLTLDQTLAETESLFIQTPTISTQVTTPSTHLYRTCPLQTLKDLADSGDPIWSLHVTYLKDSTIIGLTFPHIMDARGYQTLLTGLMQALADRPIPPLLSYDPWLKILPEALKSSVQVGAAWNVESIQEMQRDIVADIEATGPMQTRIVYFPAEEVTRLKQKAMADIRKAGYTDVQWVSTSDVLSAWFYQHAFLDLPSDELATRFLCNIDSRKYFPEIFPSSYGYLQNSFFTIATEPQFTVKQLHNMTFGEITRAIHLLVKSYALRKPLMGILKGFHEHQGDFYISFSPGGHLQGKDMLLTLSDNF
ncbi:hypothetical protein RhiLY_14385 [Ceratobasidium sp. AG-Ba]|nr:hypothetical protein RhiLY_14385 [Ceratobasidium sp. AG-Ba]